MSAGDISRRRVLTTGLGAGLAVAVGGELPALADEITRPASSYKPVRAAGDPAAELHSAPEMAFLRRSAR